MGNQLIYLLGKSMLSVRRIEAARACFSRVVEIEPEHVAARSALARTLATAGDIPEAIHTYRVLLKDQPRLTAERFELGCLLQSIGRHAQAVEAFKDMLERDPAALDCRLKLARSLEALGRVTEANAEYRYVLNASTVSESGHDWNAGSSKAA